jgi:hypothetical protein
MHNLGSSPRRWCFCLAAIFGALLFSVATLLSVGSSAGSAEAKPAQGAKSAKAKNCAKAKAGSAKAQACKKKGAKKGPAKARAKANCVRAKAGPAKAQAGKGCKKAQAGKDAKPKPKPKPRPIPPGSGDPGSEPRPAATYSNPVSKGTFDTFPDPSIIRAKDGFWYAYGTMDRTFQSRGDDELHKIPMARSKDMVHWEYVGDVFTDANLPRWHSADDTYYWAPDVRYLDGTYYLYYSVAHFGTDGFSNMGVATAPTPTGPWTDSGSELIKEQTVSTEERRASVVLGEVNQESGLRQVDEPDGRTAPTTIAGKSGRTTVEGGGPTWGRYVYLDVADDVAFDGEFEAAITVEYFDRGTDTFQVQYDSTAATGAFAFAGQVTKTGTDTWKTATFRVPDARFANRQQGKYDLRIEAGVGDAEAETIHRVDVAVRDIVKGPASCPTNRIDPAEFTDTDGTRYLYWGSGALCVAKLAPDGKRLTGEPPTQVVRDFAEGAYLVRRGPYYYLFYSENNCCSLTSAGYEVRVGRSTSPMGPFVDREGVPLMASRKGGTIVLSSNGNRWVGPGHNSVATDLSGQDWFVYHAITKGDPGVSYPHFGVIGQRQLLIDRLDWIDGWPTVRAGEWASEEEQTAPVTEWSAGGAFDDAKSFAEDWRREGGAWRPVSEDGNQSYVRQQGPGPNDAYLISKKKAPADVRAEADLRLPEAEVKKGAVGLVASYRDKNNKVVAWLDAETGALVTDVLVKGHSTRKEITPLPENFRFDTWHNVAVEIRGSEMTTEVTDARLDEPWAVQERKLPEGSTGVGPVGVASRGARAEADNVGAAALYEPVKEAVTPEIGELDPSFSDEFNDGVDPGSETNSPWSWVRQPDGEETDGIFRWRTQGAALDRGSNNASVLLRQTPPGDWTAEVKLSMDLGAGTSDRNFQQAGLVAYDNDDLYAKLAHIAIGDLRRTEFLKEVNNDLGSMFVGPPADTTWLRLSRHVDPDNGEHEIRAATSRDGENWTWGGVWSLPPDADPRIGLVSLGGVGGTAEFDYLRVYRP